MAKQTDCNAHIKNMVFHLGRQIVLDELLLNEIVRKMSFVEKPLPKVPLEYGTSVDDLERQVNKYVRGSRQAKIEQLFNYAEELLVKLRAEREI